VAIKVEYKGLSNGQKVNVKHDLLFNMIKHVEEDIGLKADKTITVVYPYIANSYKFKAKWVLLKLLKILRINVIDDDFCFLLGVESKSSLFVTHENLERGYWWNNLGRFLIDSDIHRLTFWPKSVDPKGERFPYWYNYVDWAEYPIDNQSLRYSKLLDIATLMKPLEQTTRKDEAVYVGSHLDFPREYILQHHKKKLEINALGKDFGVIVDDKYSELTNYKYNFCPENSTGFGYDTEKLPEAWNAGCVPLGAFINSMSDFNPALIGDDGFVDEKKCYSEPLLIKKPSLDNIHNYLRYFLEEVNGN
jgi:hypothetical protein